MIILNKNLDKTKKEHENKMNQLKADHTQEIQEREKEKNNLLEEIEKLKKQIEEVTSEKEKLQGLIDVEVNARKEAESRIQGAIDKMNQTIEEYDQKTIFLEKSYADKEAKLKRELKDKMDKLIKENVEDMESMQMELQKLQDEMDERYNQLLERYNEIQNLYDNRPSRPEDLETIKKLLHEIEQKDNLLKKAAEDMKFYKLELVNRENSYNKMFGTNPNVGVMNPRTAIKK